MSFGGDQELQITLGLVGKAGVIQATNSYTSLVDITDVNAWSNFQASLKENNITVTNATKADMMFDMGLDVSQYTIGSNGSLGAIPEGLVNATGKFDTLFEDATYLNKAENETLSVMEVSLTDSKTPSEIVSFKVPEIKYSPNKPSLPGPQGIQASLDYQGFYKEGADNSCVVVTFTRSRTPKLL
jgi:hypothetical protein